ncbi:hypothetical protein M430DRAFT_33135 [Amorphotheca resinae ATCC 22711]|uniref:Uncharacterized protein n=1 Tax=Amorphotheca resinae ATCC 22711 TaxID=857342 RepID=A0A2T3BAT2_AMORE|nr:hypothetical protein M430DRAFT_33135 [Amorphotheca resinae ATCC 22711]PSS25408.1 hypothetical protein M430DRAFT_33135 [Amorphotheca resinae ATCC 22711]
MAGPHLQIQTEVSFSPRSSRPDTLRPDSFSLPRPQSQPPTTSSHAHRASTCSISSDSTSSACSPQETFRNFAIDFGQARVEVLRCSRCAKSVETVSRSRSADGSRRVSNDEAMANGMVSFGHNLYYCDRCAKIVGYT